MAEITVTAKKRKFRNHPVSRTKGQHTAAGRLRITDKMEATRVTLIRATKVDLIKTHPKMILAKEKLIKIIRIKMALEMAQIKMKVMKTVPRVEMIAL